MVEIASATSRGENSTIAAEFSAPTEWCHYVDDNQGRFWLHVVFGSALALLAFLGNSLMLTVLSKNRQNRASFNIYFIALSSLDAIMSFSYIPLMAMTIFIDSTGHSTMAFIQSHYLIPLMALAHIAKTSTAYVIVFAAVERTAVSFTLECNAALKRCRLRFILSALLIGIVAKLTSFFQFSFEMNRECIGTIREWTLAGTAVYYNIWHDIFKFCSTLVTVQETFLLLFILCIILAKRKQHGQHSEDAENDRIFTQTLFLIVIGFLLCNALNFVLTLLEPFIIQNIDAWRVLDTMHYCQALFETLDCGLRIPIYFYCQPRLREEASVLAASIFHRRNRSETKGEDAVSYLEVMETENHSAPLIVV